MGRAPGCPDYVAPTAACVDLREQVWVSSSAVVPVVVVKVGSRGAAGEGSIGWGEPLAPSFSAESPVRPTTLTQAQIGGLELLSLGSIEHRGDDDDLCGALVSALAPDRIE